MNKKFKRCIAILVSVALMLEVVPVTKNVREVKAESLPFTLEDTMDGVLDTNVVAKKLELTDDNAELIDVGFPDLAFVMTSLSDDVKKIDVVGMTGIIHSFKVKQSDMDWPDYVGYGWDNEIYGWFEHLEDLKNYVYVIYQEEKDSIYVVKNPETKKYDLVNATTGKYYEYGATRYQYIPGKRHSRELGADYYDVVGISCFTNTGSLSDASTGKIILDSHGEILLKDYEEIISFDSKNRIVVVCSSSINESSIFVHNQTVYLIDKEDGIIAKTDEIVGSDEKVFGKKNLLIDPFQMDSSCYIDIESGEIKTLGFTEEDEDQNLTFEGASDEGIYAIYEDYGLKSGTIDAFYNVYFISPDGKKKKLKYDNFERTVGEDSVVCSTINYSDQKILYVLQGGEEVFQCISNEDKITNENGSYSWSWDIDIGWWQGEYGYLRTDYGKTGKLITKEGKVIRTFDEKINKIKLYNNRLFTYYSEKNKQYYVYDIETRKMWEGSLGPIGVGAESEKGSKYYNAYTIQCEKALLGELNGSIINFDNGKKYKYNKSYKCVCNIYEDEDSILIQLDWPEDYSLVNQDMEVVDKKVWYLTSLGNYYKEDGVYNKYGEKIQECYPISLYRDYYSPRFFNPSELIAASTDEDAKYDWDNSFTYYDAEGQRLTDQKYYQTSAFHADLAYVYDGERAEVIDNYGSAVISLEVGEAPFATYKSMEVMRYHSLFLQNTEKKYYFYNFSNLVSSEGQSEDDKYKRDKQNSQSKLLANAESIPDFKFKGMDVTFTVPDEVPVLGGGEMSLDFGKVPIVFEKSDNQFRFGIGIENKKSDGDDKPLLFHDSDTWGTFKKAVEKQNDNLLKGKNILLASKFGVASTPVDKSVETKIYGYAEGTLDNGRIISTEGKMVMEISFSASKKWQTMIVVVPVVFTAEIEAGGKFTMELGIDYSKSSAFCKGEFEFTLPKVRLSAGVGVAYVADVSAYGSFTNTLKLSQSYGGEPSVTDTVSGELGASASLFCLTYEKALWEGKKQIYPKNGDKLKTRKNSFMGEIEESDFVIDRDYADKTSEWMNQTENSGLSAQIQVLQKNVYAQANPQIVSLEDGTKLMVFITDLGERNIGNHTAVAYSMYDDSKARWSEPKVVDDDGTADFYPEIATDGVHTYLAWVNAKRTDFTKDTTVSEMAEACDISVARFDSEAKKFVDITSLTNNSYADLRPSITIKDGVACVTWIANKNNDCIEMSGKNEICYALNENGQWGEDKLYLLTEKPVTDVKVGEFDSEIKIAYTIDEDADFTTAEDVRLYIGNLVDEDKIVVGDRKNISNLQFAKLGGKNILAFSDDTGLCYMEDLDECHNLLDEEERTGAAYQFVTGNNSDMVICSEPTDQGSDIKGYIVKGGNISLSIPLTSQENYIKSPNGFYEKGKYYIAFTREQVNVAHDALDVSADICVMQFGEYTDAAVTDVDVAEDTIIPGSDGEVAVRVSNLGIKDISECTIRIKNGKETVGISKVKELKPGVETEEVVSIRLPEGYNEGTKLICEVITEGDEYSKNDSLEFEAGKPNLELDVFTPETVTYANVYVTNTSGFDSKGVLNIYETNDEGKVLKSIELGEIQAGERKQIKLTSTDLDAIATPEGSLCFKVVSDKEETYYSDNYGFVFVEPQDSSEKDDDEKDDDEKDDGSDPIGEEDINITPSPSPSPSTTTPPSPQGSISKEPNATKNPSISKSTPEPYVRTSPTVKAPGKVKLKKIKALGKRKVRVSWKLGSQDGYQLQYAMNRSFTKKRKTHNKKFYISSVTLKKLKKGKTYYFRVRAYRKTSDGGKKYGKWSNIRKIKVK